MLSVMPNVIEKSVRTVVVHGLAVSVAKPCVYVLELMIFVFPLKDFILVAEGTRIAIQYVHVRNYLCVF